MRIPDAQGLGQRVAQNPGSPSISPQQLDGGLTRAAAGLGQTLEAIGGNMQQDRQHAEDVQRREGVEVLRQEAAQRDAANRATAQAAVGSARDGLDDLLAGIDEGVQTGRIDKTKAGEEWQKQSADLLSKSMQGVPKDFQGIVQNDISTRAARLQNKVGEIVRKRDQSDTLTGINTTLEYAQRLSIDDPTTARKLVADTVDQLAPFAGLNPAAASKLKQTTLEGISFTRAYTAVNMARSNNGALLAAEKQIATDTDIDPQKRAQLLTTAAGYRASNDQRAEMAAQRAERQADAHLRRAEAAYNVFQSTADRGTALDPAYIEQAAKATAGTPYADGVRTLAAQAAETGGLAAQPIKAQRTMLDQLNQRIAADGATPALMKRRDAQEKVLRGSEADLDKDGLRAGLERGVITEIQPLDMSSMQGIAAGLQTRMAQSQDVAAWAGRPVSPLTAEESEQVGTMLTALPTPQRSAAIATLAGTLGPQASGALATQINKKDRGLALALATATDRTTTGRYTSELILKGQQAKKDGTSTKGDKAPDLKASNWRADLATQLEGAFPSQTMRDAALDSAELISHGIAAEQGGALSDDDRRRAIRLAVGGNFIQHNGRPLPTPPGVDEDKLDDRLRSVSVDEIKAQAGGDTVRAGGVDVPVADFVKKLPGQQLMFSSPGKYMVLVDGRPVVNAKRRPIIVGVQ